MSENQDETEPRLSDMEPKTDPKGGATSLQTTLKPGVNGISDGTSNTIMVGIKDGTSNTIT